MGFKAGDAIRLVSFEHTYATTKMRFKAPKGKVFVAVLVGLENKKENTLDIRKEIKKALDGKGDDIPADLVSVVGKSN